jgi:hypothetical protein
MADRTPNVLDRKILSTGLRYQLAGEEIVDNVGPLGLGISNVGGPKRLVAKLHQATLDMPVTLKAIPLRQVSNLVDHSVAIVNACGRCRPPLTISRPAPRLQDATHVSLTIALPVPATHVCVPRGVPERRTYPTGSR